MRLPSWVYVGGVPAISPPNSGFTGLLPGCNLKGLSNCQVTSIDPPLGDPATIALFDELLLEVDQFSPEETAMGDSDSPACDLDGDDDCDQGDRQTLSQAKDDCIGDPGYNAFADFDGDGCVTDADELLLSKLFPLAVPAPSAPMLVALGASLMTTALLRRYFRSARPSR